MPLNGVIYRGPVAYQITDPGTAGQVLTSNGASNPPTFEDASAASLDDFTGDSGSGGIRGLVPAPAAGDAAAGKFLAADGTWDVPAGSGSPSDGGGTGVIGIVIYTGGSVISTGTKGFVRVPLACTIVKATVLSIDPSATSGSIVVDVWKDSFANFPPTDADSITASAPPTLSSANKSEDSTLTGWTTSISAGDVIGFNVDSATTVTKVMVLLDVEAA